MPYTDITKRILFWFLTAVALLPLFFIPGGLNAFGMDNADKYLWLGILAVVVLSVLLVGQMKGKLVSSPRIGPLEVVFLVWGVLMGFNVLLALDWFSAMFGAHGQAGLPFYGVVTLVLGYFLLVGALRNAEMRVFFSKRALLASGLAIITGLLSIFFGNILPEAVGSLEGLSLLAGLVVVVLAGFFLFQEKSKNNQRALIWRLLAGAALFFLVITNFAPAWIAVAAGLVSVLAAKFLVGRISNEEDKQPIRQAIIESKWLIILLMVSFFYIYANYSLYDQALLSRRYQAIHRADPVAGSQVACRAFEERTLFGFGLDNYEQAYSRFRGAQANLSPYWDRVYSRDWSTVGEMIANIGIIGLASYLLIWVTLITYAVFGFISVVKQGQKENERLARIAGISGGLFALAVGQLFFSFNAVLFFAIIVLAALLRVELGSYCNWFEKSIQGEVIPKKDSRIGLAGLFFLLATVLLLTVWAGKYRYASHIYAGSQGEPDSIVRASQLSPGRYQYQIALAAALRHRFDGLPESSYEDKSETINLAAEAARVAVKKAPYSASAWQILAGVYGVIAPGSREAASVAQEALGQAISIDANNPVLPETAGAIYYQSGNYSEAQKAYQRSLILKPGYYPAALGLARTYLAQDKPEKSLPLLEELSRKESSPDIYLFMGKAYFNVGRLEEARENFQKVLAFSPNNSNALYSLGLVYEQAGETGQALHYFQKVQDLNPENQEVKAKIEELEKESE